MRGVHFLGFERAVGGAVVEAIGDGLAVGGEFLAGGVGEDIEALEGDEQGLGEFGEHGFDFRVGQGGGEFHRGVARGTGELRQVLDVVDAGEQFAQFGEIEFGDEDRRGEIEFAFAGGLEAGEDAEVLVVRLDVAAEGEAVASRGEKRMVLLGTQGGDEALEVVEVGGGPVWFQPAGRGAA